MSNALALSVLVAEQCFMGQSEESVLRWPPDTGGSPVLSAEPVVAMGGGGAVRRR